MKTELPERAHYYRPMRARELRVRTVWLRLIGGALRWMAGAVLIGAPLLGGEPLLRHLQNAPPSGDGLLDGAVDVITGMVLAAVAVVVGTALLFWLGCALSGRADRDLWEAYTLEAEHAGRYSSLADEVS